jgi:hypothetical protein
LLADLGDIVVKKIISTLLAGMMTVVAAPAFSILPLVTDDTGTQRPNKTTHQVEFSYDRLRDKDGGVTARAGVPGFTYTYGISDPLDVFIGTTYSRITLDDPASGTARTNGIGDTTVGLKWRFYEKNDFSAAIRPQITLSTGDENKGLGNGRTSGAVALLLAYEANPVTLLANVGYTRNNYKLTADQNALRSNLLSVSAAALFQVHDKAKVFADIGSITNADRTSNTSPAYFMFGLIYSPNKDIDLDVGLKFGINKPEVDRTWSIGATFRF